jgi:hypothetical protein
MEALQNQVFSHVLTSDSIVLQEGAKQIYLKNTGAANATWTGDKSNGTQPSTPVTLGVAETFEFGETGAGYKQITIDATSTTVEIIAIY